MSNKEQESKNFTIYTYNYSTNYSTEQRKVLRVHIVGSIESPLDLDRNIRIFIPKNNSGMTRTVEMLDYAFLQKAGRHSRKLSSAENKSIKMRTNIATDHKAWSDNSQHNDKNTAPVSEQASAFQYGDAIFLLELLCSPSDRDALIGDLIEAYNYVQHTYGNNRARLYFWVQFYKTFGALLWATLKRPILWLLGVVGLDWIIGR